MSFTATLKYGSPSYDEDKDSKGVDEVWSVQSTVANPTIQSVLSAPGLPQRSQSHAGDYWLQVSTRKVQQITDYLFEVSIGYAYPEGSGTEEDGDPVNQPPEISYSTVLYQEPMDQDMAGNLLLTANFEPYDPPISVDQDDMQMSVTKNFATFSPADMAKYQNKVNSTTWLGFDPWTCRVTGIAGQEVRNADGDIQYYRVSVTIQIRERKDPDGNMVGWKRRLIHQGFRVWAVDANGVGLFRDGGVGKLYETAKDKGEFVTEPVLLAEDGKRLTSGQAVVFHLFEPYEKIDFNNMNLGV